MRLFPDWVKMLDESRPEALTVTVPNKRHLEVVRECARRRIQVWFQKPLAASVADWRCGDDSAFGDSACGCDFQSSVAVL